MEPIKLKILVETTYGQVRYYPECEKSRLFLTLLRQNSFTKGNLAIIKKLGYDFDLTIPEAHKIS